jgi:hypothetical protein
VATPGVKTIEALSAFLNIPPEKTAKAVFMVAVVVSRTGRSSGSSLPWCGATWR